MSTLDSVGEEQALLAQWIARWTSNPKVAGSSPAQGNSFFQSWFGTINRKFIWSPSSTTYNYKRLSELAIGFCLLVTGCCC